jgi:hypothetical protein
MDASPTIVSAVIVLSESDEALSWAATDAVIEHRATTAIAKGAVMELQLNRRGIIASW